MIPGMKALMLMTALLLVLPACGDGEPPDGPEPVGKKPSGDSRPPMARRSALPRPRVACRSSRVAR